ncbi:hypothetical protein X798_03521 [Onchocerca flexuosa]|uniref:Uncharacterized protein n=1 Tax=Onchocerca flexuosa TaxID=387005 RepID=A0A238BW84_9BILA|nr:hypothetical protein X798_03521 [Onchocerca flexuosa]
MEKVVKVTSESFSVAKKQVISGFVQLLLSTIFFSIYAAAAKIGEGKWCCNVLHFVGCVVYLLVTFILLLIGIIGFYWVVKLYGYVEYEDRQSANYVDMELYKSSLFIFSFQICIALLKCYCWNR